MIQIYRFLIFTLFTTSHSFASGEIKQADCHTIDYSKRMGDVRYQGTAESCFAFVSADLIGFNQNLPTGKRVSALDVQLNSIVADPTVVQSAIDKLGNWELSHWAATSVIPKMKENRSAEFNKPLKERFALGGTPSITLLSYNASGGMCMEDKLPSEGARAYAESENYIYNRVSQLPIYQKTFGSTRLPVTRNCNEFDPLAKLRSEENDITNAAAKRLAAELQKKCGNRTPLRPFNAMVFRMDRGQSSSAAQILAAALAQGLPLGISYDADFLTKGLLAEQSSAGHASVVAGSRWNSELSRCEFKIRNSWGISCEPYAPDIRKNCEAGNIWVSEETINLRVQTVFGIDPQK